jgi:hypothetical protein
MTTTIRLSHGPLGTLNLTPLPHPRSSSQPSRQVVTQQTLSLWGATLVYEFGHNSEFPRAEIYDVELARPWVHHIFGEPVAALITAGVGHADGSSGELTTAAALMARALWMQRYWPNGNPVIPSLPESALEAEQVGLAWRLRDVLTSLDVFIALADKHASGIVESLNLHWQLAPTKGAGLEFLRIQDSAEGLLRFASVESSDYRQCQKLLASCRAWTAPPGPPTPLRRSVRTQPDLALIASREPQGNGTVDWRQVPPRVVPDVEGNVTWAHPGEALRVSVQALPTPNPVPDLVARVYSESELVAVVPLASTKPPTGPHRFKYQGRAQLTRAVSCVDVCSVRWAAAARTSHIARAQARAERDAIRTLITSRLGALGSLDQTRILSTELQALYGSSTT